MNINATRILHALSEFVTDSREADRAYRKMIADAERQFKERTEAVRGGLKKRYAVAKLFGRTAGKDFDTYAEEKLAASRGLKDLNGATEKLRLYCETQQKYDELMREGAEAVRAVVKADDARADACMASLKEGTEKHEISARLYLRLVKTAGVSAEAILTLEKETGVKFAMADKCFREAMEKAVNA